MLREALLSSTPVTTDHDTSDVRAAAAAAADELYTAHAPLLRYIAIAKFHVPRALVAGITISVVRIATAPEGQTGRVAAQESGAWAGALAVGAAGAKGGAIIGSFIGPEGTIAGAAIGGIGGGIIGSFAGEKAANDVYNATVDH